MKVIGLQKVTGTNKKGEQYTGVRVYGTYLSNKVNGMACESVFLNDKYCPGADALAVGDDIRITYNRFGNVEGFVYA